MRTLRLLWLMLVDAFKLWGESARSTGGVGAVMVAGVSETQASSWAAPATTEESGWLERDLIARTTKAGS